MFHRPSYGVYISQLIRFARGCSHVEDFYARNKCLAAKLLNRVIGIISFILYLFPFWMAMLHRPSYGVYISQLIRFARGCSHVENFHARIKCLAAKLVNRVIGIISFILYFFPFWVAMFHRPSYGVYISQLIRFARVCSHVEDFHARIKCLAAKLLNRVIGIISFILYFSFLDGDVPSSLLWSVYFSTYKIF